jgi:hypothetical protein
MLEGRTPAFSMPYPKSALSKTARCKLPSTKPKFWQSSPNPIPQSDVVDYSFLRAALKK